MKKAILSFIALCVITTTGFALTTQERNWAEEARGYFAKAKEQAAEQQKVLEEQDRENSVLDQLAQGQRQEIVRLSTEIETAHKNELAAVAWRKSNEPVITQVNKYWGLGAFAYGFKVLSRHLFILLGVLAVLAAVLFALSFAFPWIGTAFSTVLEFLRTIISRFRKK